jgi:tetratricopeptide (TPR) repeat protein
MVRSPRSKARPPRLAPDALHQALQAALSHHREGTFDAALAIYAQIEAAHPEILEVAHLHALIDIEQGRLLAALERLREVARRDPTSRPALSSLAYVHRELGQYRQALALRRRMVALDPDDVDARIALSQALEADGRLDEAAALLRELAADARASMAALAALAMLRPTSVTPKDQAAMVAAAGDPANAPNLRIALHFALGELLERQAQYDQAFEAFAAGAALKRAALTAPPPPDLERPMAAPGDAYRDQHPHVAAAARRAAVAHVKAVYAPDLFARHRGEGSHIRAPIFVVGMPRSGSTLIEQILSSHSKVQGLGETAKLAQTVDGRYPDSLLEPYGPGHFTTLAGDYLAAMHSCGWKSSPRFIDKQLGNFLQIGVIHLMFPDAVILAATRNPVDTCLAYFRKLFWSGNELSYDLREVAAEYVRYREAMAHWDAVLPGRVVPVSHEALVADPDVQIRWLVTEACGLPWEDACLRFYDTKRSVRTASVAQVRQPIFKTSIDRWRRYEKHLGPLLEALGPYAPTNP